MKKNNLAPIALFTYIRLKHLKITINSLKSNKDAKDSILYIFSDSYRNNEDKKKVLKVRKYLSKLSGFKKIIYFYRKNNLGLSQNLISGINHVLKNNQKIIIIEDDLKLSRYFLDFMNYNLSYFSNNSQVASIHGYVYPLPNIINLPNLFFIRGADCWGWGTWKRSWNYFDPNGKKLLQKIIKKNLVKEFNFNNSYNFFKILKNQVLNKNDSWAIRWHASIFLRNMLTLYPKKTYVQNIGLDGSGVHNNKYFNEFRSKFSNKLYLPNNKLDIVESHEGKKNFEIFFKKIKRKKVLIFLKRIIYFFT
jgi:hypothetical protein